MARGDHTRGEAQVPHVFLLSPASSSGERARLLTSPRAAFALAAALRSPVGATLGEVFSFMSGLYFRGKLQYATAFARPPAAIPGVPVITPSRGLRPPQERVTLDVLQEFAGIDIHADEARYAEPLRRDAGLLATLLAPHPPARVVLLGSIASDKYADVLGPALGDRLVFPADFVGRGDMSRGGLMLRAARERRELAYVPIGGAVRRGTRPPRGFVDVFRDDSGLARPAPSGQSEPCPSIATPPDGSASVSATARRRRASSTR